MRISEIITDKYKLRIPPTVYYELLADVQEAEEEQEPTTKNDLGVEEVTALEEWITKLTEANKSAYSQGYADGMKAQAKPKTGHWKPYLKEGLRYQCSVCDSRFDTPWEYCPHCGAKMAESEEA